MNRTVLTFSPENIITIWLMVGFGFFVVAFISQLVQARWSNAAGAKAGTTIVGG